MKGRKAHSWYKRKFKTKINLDSHKNQVASKNWAVYEEMYNTL